MRNKKILFLLPALGLVLTGCSLNGAIKKGKDILRPAKHWVGETLYWPTRDEIMGSESYKEEPKEETKAEETPAKETTSEEKPSETTPTEVNPSTPTETTGRVEITDLEEKRAAYIEIQKAYLDTISLSNVSYDTYINGKLRLVTKSTDTREITYQMLSGDQVEILEYIEIYEEFAYYFSTDENGDLVCCEIYDLSGEEIEYEEPEVSISDEELNGIEFYKEDNTYYIRGYDINDLYQGLLETHPDDADVVEAFCNEIGEVPFCEFTIENGIIAQYSEPVFSGEQQYDSATDTTKLNLYMYIYKIVYYDVDTTIVERPEGVEIPPEEVINLYE